MKIWKGMNKIPGGNLLIPMLIGAIINTAFPNLMTWLGGTSLATFKTGSMTVVGIILFALGTTTDIKTLGTVLKRNGIVTIAKLVLGFGFGLLFVKLFGIDGIAGVSAVAFVTCICSGNPGIYIGLVNTYGDPADMGNVPIMSVLDLPWFPMLILAAGGAKLPPADVITVFVPYILGIILGNIDKDFGKLYQPMANIILPFLGFNFGMSLNLLTAAKAGLAGIVLGIVYMILNFPVLLFADRVLNKRPGYVGASMCSVAGFSIVLPTLLGEAYAQYLPTAIPQIALCLVVSAILCPILTKKVVDKWGSSKVPPKSERTAEATE